MVKNPLFRFLERECSVLASLLQVVKKDFTLVLAVCSGESKSTNYSKKVAEGLHADVVPLHWKKYTVPDLMTATEWLADFKRRVEQVKDLAGSSDYGRSGMWFGGLLAPEAFLIATQ